jgi:hypothetical protein
VLKKTVDLAVAVAAVVHNLLVVMVVPVLLSLHILPK